MRSLKLKEKRLDKSIVLLEMTLIKHANCKKLYMNLMTK